MFFPCSCCGFKLCLLVMSSSSLSAVLVIFHTTSCSLSAQVFCSFFVNIPIQLKCLPAIRETWVRSLGWEDPLKEGMATQSSILAWRILMDRGAWWATVHGVAKSRTRLSDFTFTFFPFNSLSCSSVGEVGECRNQL